MLCDFEKFSQPIRAWASYVIAEGSRVHLNCSLCEFHGLVCRELHLSWHLARTSHWTWSLPLWIGWLVSNPYNPPASTLWCNFCMWFLEIWTQDVILANTWSTGSSRHLQCYLITRWHTATNRNCGINHQIPLVTLKKTLNSFFHALETEQSHHFHWPPPLLERELWALLIIEKLFIYLWLHRYLL